MNDMSMLIAVHAQRDASTGKFTPNAHQMLEDVARWIRLYHLLFWAGQVKPSRGDVGVSFSVLLTERGLNALVARKAITKSEYALLVNDQLAETERHHAVLEWIIARFITAQRNGLLLGAVAMESRFLEEACKLRAVCASISDDAAARMPLSYVHLVQLLVDTLVALAPFALYPKLGVLTVMLSGILVIFFRGFVQLSKSFLDPFGNDDSLSENLNVNTLICESNKGSVRWSKAIHDLPFSTSE